jgi:protein TonB
MKWMNQLFIEDPESDEGDEVIIYDMPDEDPVIEDTPIQPFMCEDLPVFPGGEAAYLKYISSNTVYPDVSRDNESYGTVYISFIVDKKGNVKNVKIVKGVDPFIDKEALRVFEAMPKWKPGKQNGIPVSVTQMGRVSFTLNN